MSGWQLVYVVSSGLALTIGGALAMEWLVPTAGEPHLFVVFGAAAAVTFGLHRLCGSPRSPRLHVEVLRSVAIAVPLSLWLDTLALAGGTLLISRTDAWDELHRLEELLLVPVRLAVAGTSLLVCSGVVLSKRRAGGEDVDRAEA
jgi:hypothetical protein